MDGAVGGEGRISQGVDRGRVDDVGDEAGDVVAAVPKLADRLVEGGRFDVGQHHPHPLSCEGIGQGPADAAGPTGDDGGLPAQVVHAQPCPAKS